MQLLPRNTNRLTPCNAACLARLRVASTLTARKADSGSTDVSCITCTRAAKWMTTSQPDNALDQSVASDKSPISHSVGLVLLRTAATNVIPRRANSSHSAAPTNPLAPVTRILCVFMMCLHIRRGRDAHLICATFQAIWPGTSTIFSAYWSVCRSRDKLSILPYSAAAYCASQQC